jgi:hypothetical protein
VRREIMTKKFLVFGAVMALTVVLATPAYGRADARPFHATIEGSRGDTETTFVGSGSVTHLGEVQFEGQREFGPLDSNLCLPLLSLTITFTAANGDELFVEAVSGGLCFVSSDGITTVFAGDADVALVGGSGRFEDATGEAAMSLTVVSDLSTGVPSFTGSFSGTIGY